MIGFCALVFLLNTDSTPRQSTTEGHTPAPNRAQVVNRFLSTTFRCGSRNVLCLLDTGSPQTYLRSELIQSVGKPQGSSSDADATGPLSVGGHVWPSVDFYTGNEKVLETGDQQKMDGLVGLDILKSCSISYSKVSQQVQLDPDPPKTLRALIKSLGPVKKGKVVELSPMDLTADGFYLACKINGSSVNLLVDTGGYGCLLRREFVNRIGFRAVRKSEVSTPQHDSMTSSVLPDVMVSIGSGLASKTTAWQLPETLAQEDVDDDFGRVDGMIGNNLLDFSGTTVLDFRDSVLVAVVPKTRHILSQAHLTRYRELPRNAGELVVSPSEEAGYFQVTCGKLGRPFAVRGDALLPVFSTQRIVQRALHLHPDKVQSLKLAPEESAPSHWLTLQSAGALPMAYPPVGTFYSAGETMARFDKTWTRSPCPGGGFLIKARETISPTKPHPLEVLATLPNGETERMESSVPIKIPLDWSMSYPKNWAVSRKGKSLVLTPPGCRRKDGVPPPNFTGQYPNNHYRYFTEISAWTEIPNNLWPPNGKIVAPPFKTPPSSEAAKN